MPDSEREWWRARHAQKAGEHAGSGFPAHSRDICDDPEHDWYPQMTVCHAEMELATAEAQFARLHEKRPWHDGTFTDWTEEPDADHPYHYSFGTRIWVAAKDFGFGGDFTTREKPFETDDEEEGTHGHSA